MIRSDITSAGRYRAEVNGLRAVAIAMVACYHIWFGRVSGGIDIFLLISSFLLMQTFLRRIDAGRDLNLVGYWVRAFRRLVFPAVVTILGTLVLVFTCYSSWRWRASLADAGAALFYFENWRLAFSAADYYADKATISPFQHFWSLSMQGQIFLLWPALIGLCWVFAGLSRSGRPGGTIRVFLSRAAVSLFGVPRGWSHSDSDKRALAGGPSHARRTRAWLLVLFGVVFAASLVWSSYQTRIFQSFAYFSTLTRLWEFALGALLALILPWVEQRIGALRPGGPAVFRGVLGWVGLIGVLSCGLVIDVQGFFPGFVALWPTLAACAVIIAGHTGLSWGVDRFLASRVLGWLGDISYALYLVHWPILVTVARFAGGDSLPVSWGIMVLVLSLVSAWALTRFVDEPVRYSPWAQAKRLRSVAVIALALAMGVGVLVVSQVALDWRARQIYSSATGDAPGAMALLDPRESSYSGPLVPAETDLPDDWFGLDEECSEEVLDPSDPLAIACWMKTGSGAQVVAVGNSRMEQYMAALTPIAEERGWGLTAFLRGGCPHQMVDRPEGQYEVDIDPMASGEERSWAMECWQWNQMLYRYILDTQPDYVIMESTFVTMGGREVLMPGIIDLVGTYTAAGIDVITIRDMPRLPMNPLDCLDTLDRAECEVPADFYSANDPSLVLLNAVQGTGQVYLLDPVPYLCPGDNCPLVIGGVYVYMDEWHISATYAATMAQPLAKQLDEQGL